MSVDSPRLTMTLLHRIAWLITKAERLAVDYWDCEYSWDAGQIASELYRIRERFKVDEFRIAIRTEVDEVDAIYYQLNEVERLMVAERGDL